MSISRSRYYLKSPADERISGEEILEVKVKSNPENGSGLSQVKKVLSFFVGRGNGNVQETFQQTPPRIAYRE